MRVVGGGLRHRPHAVIDHADVDQVAQRGDADRQAFAAGERFGQLGAETDPVDGVRGQRTGR